MPLRNYTKGFFLGGGFGFEDTIPCMCVPMYMAMHFIPERASWASPHFAPESSVSCTAGETLVPTFF